MFALVTLIAKENCYVVCLFALVTLIAKENCYKQRLSNTNKQRLILQSVRSICTAEEGVYLR